MITNGFTNRLSIDVFSTDNPNVFPLPTHYSNVANASSSNVWNYLHVGRSLVPSFDRHGQTPVEVTATKSNRYSIKRTLPLNFRMPSLFWFGSEQLEAETKASANVSYVTSVKLRHIFHATIKCSDIIFETIWTEGH